MGEFLVETPAVERKMEESGKFVPRLDASFSFGRFENDAISWEKWSSFSPNKYLEEVGSLSTPGSVAQKKAYFEAHYKKIAAKKAEEMEQEKLATTDIINQDNGDNTFENLKKDELCTEDHIANPSTINAKFGLSDDAEVGKKTYFEAHYKKIAAKLAEELEQEKLINRVTRSPHESCGEDNIGSTSGVEAEFTLSYGEKLVKENAPETCEISLTEVAVSSETKDDNATSSEEVEQGSCSNCLLPTILSDKKRDASVVDCDRSIIENNEIELSGKEGGPELNASEDAVSAVLETSLKGSQAITENHSGRKNAKEWSNASKKENSKLNTRSIPQQSTPNKKEKNVAGSKKIAVSSAVKPSHTSTPRYSKTTSISTPRYSKTTSISTPRYSKTTSISTPLSSSQSSKKKVNEPTQSQNKNVMVGESKRASPAVFHTPFSLGSSNSSPVLPVTRNYLIMERMGDKEIVKRAFKAFQNRNCGSSDENFSRVKQMSSPASESKLSTVAARKINEGLKKDVGKLATQSSQSARRPKLLSTGLHKSPPLDKRIEAARLTSNGLRSDEGAEKQKEDFEAKSIAGGAENVQRSGKSKEAREAEMKKLRESLNFKAKPLPSFYMGSRKS